MVSGGTLDQRAHPGVQIAGGDLVVECLVRGNGPTLKALTAEFGTPGLAPLLSDKFGRVLTDRHIAAPQGCHEYRIGFSKPAFGNTSQQVDIEAMALSRRFIYPEIKFKSLGKFESSSNVADLLDRYGSGFSVKSLILTRTEAR
jgi:hypothetical protein